jgi:hypothetical protein
MKKFISATDKNPLSGMYVAEPVYRYLKELERVPMAMRDGVIPSALRGYDKVMGGFRNATLYNPMIHNHNTFGNYFVSAGGDMKAFTEAKKLLEGSKDVSKEMEQSYAWAEKTGALGNDAHSNRFKVIDNLLDGKKAQGAFKRFQDKTLWTPEKQLRLGLFHEARMANLEKGMGEAQAANAARDAVNTHLADYTSNNLSGFEKEVMMRLDPYYKWHKSNYPLQIKNLFNPNVMGRRSLADRALSQINNATSGHSQQDNVGDDKEKRKIHLAMGDGKYASIDPYVPWQESNKMLEEPFGNFMWNRLSPLIRTPILQMLNEKFYPSTSLTPDGGESMANQPIEGKFDTPMEALNKRFTSAADSLAPSYIKNITELLGSPVGRAENPDNPNIDPRIRMLIGATGAFVNPAPTSQQKVDQNKRIQAKHDIDEKIKYLIGKKRRGE